MGSEKRQRTKRYPVRFFPEEFEEAERKAKAFSYPSVASLIRDLVTGVEPTSTLDQQAILELLRVNADLGRLGGLLKHWLQAKGMERNIVPDISALLRDIEDAQRKLKKKVKSL
ncbi:plasmid mobilization protein [Sedimenticola sp.]|uniref:plasmid mobilization protein n=1 Tax=Sedimenticola sp. TaxID=1940285 RepID=UPI003D0F173E